MSRPRPSAAATGRRPNILLLMTDEHGAQFSGTGHPFIATPAMDRLASEGVTFDAAYCNNSQCVPSRLSFLTWPATRAAGVEEHITAAGLRWDWSLSNREVRARRRQAN